jgi:Kef-type K+ transport system membrane component KefB
LILLNQIGIELNLAKIFRNFAPTSKVSLGCWLLPFCLGIACFYIVESIEKIFVDTKSFFVPFYWGVLFTITGMIILKKDFPTVARVLAQRMLLDSASKQINIECGAFDSTSLCN